MAVTPRQQERYFQLRRQGWNQSAAAREAGISRSSAVRVEKARGSTGAEARAMALERAGELRGAIPLDQLDDDAKRGLADFEFFRRTYLGHVSTPWQVQTAERLVELIETPDKEYVVQNGPPGAGKTTLLHDFACWVTARDRSIRGLIGSRKANNANRMARRLRRSLERPLPLKAATEDIALGLAVDCERSLAQAYGRFKPENGDVWRGEEFIVEQFDDVPIEEKEPTWSAYGVDSGVLGNRFEVILWDDLVDRTNTRTVETQQGLQELWDAELETRLEPGGLLVLMGQRLAAGDLYAYCRSKKVEIDDEDEEGQVGSTDSGLMYHRIVYRAHDEDRCEEVHRRGEAKPWPEGCLLDPYRLPWKELRRIKALNKTTYEVTYQQEDIDPEGVLVNPIWVKGGKGADGVMHPGCWDYERGIDERPLGLGAAPLSVVSVDPSPTKYWALTWWTSNTGLSLATTLRYLMDVYRQKMTAPEFLYAEPDPSAPAGYRFSGQLENWRARAESLGMPLTHVIIEENAAQRFFTQQPYFRQWCSTHRISFLPHQTSRNKNDPSYGVQSLGELWKFGLIRLPGKPNDPGRTAALKLVDEVQKWPGGAYDDCVMSHWFHEVALPRIAVPDVSKIPRLSRPTWVADGEAPRPWAAAG